MKRKYSVAMAIILSIFIVFSNSIGLVQAKGSHSSSHSSSTSHSSKASSGSFKSGSFSSGTSKSSSTKSKDTISKSSESGFKSGLFSGSKSSTNVSKSTSSTNSNGGFFSGIFSKNKSSNTIKQVNTSAPALKSIPSNYSCHSISNHYYYNTSNGGNNFLSNYLLYRALTPQHRTYVSVGGSKEIAPAYTGPSSVLPDIITTVIIIAIICIGFYIIKKRKTEIIEKIKEIKNRIKK